MISEKMVDYVKGSSVIRAMFEEGQKLAKIYGEENVYDFSLGNPSVEPPAKVKEAIVDIITNENAKQIHGYMLNAGYEDVRTVIADSLNKKHGTSLKQDNIIMTVGAAGGLNVILKTLLNPGDEVIVFAPFFGEYRSYVKNFEGELVIISPDTDTFLPNLKEFYDKITSKTKAVIVNTPNNPTGVVYSEKVIMALAEVLNKKQDEYGTAIYLIADEPYREIVYSNQEVPFIPKYYDNTIVGYSYSKSLSLPGERIGYLVIPAEVDDFENVVSAAGVATRILGFVNAPSLMQKVIARCIDEEVDIEVYNRNRELLYNTLTEYGFECVKPDGAFYLWMKILGDNEAEFVKKAKEFNLLIVGGSAFGGSGYVRMAYCVDYDMIVRALPAFKKLAEAYQA
ncbi:pyridoxal phosphate-dependent aminotransferase [Anaeromicropila populeti]|uniref:Aminotransferase n=1 Tax=Anaeromicropila populeti TaxID=37658 RepID=A0A1I6HKQ1_9FIRM|nr:pyridoxal phosphate-dependent aminotransferase [Anaeromicropila populeti]SFR54880.1 aspartate aminotransferase [Anaeromicropila populeti]